MTWKTLVVSLLVVGFVAAQTASEEEQTARILAQFQMPDEVKQVIRSEVAKDCAGAGAQDKTEDASNAIIEFCDCAFRLYAEDNHNISKLFNAMSGGNTAPYWKTNCDKAEQLLSCLVASVEGYAPCAQKDLLQSINTVMKDLGAVVDFACFNDGERLIPLTTEKVMMCAMSQHEAIKECYDKIGATDNYMNALRNMNNGMVCAKVEKVSKCAAQALQGCDSPAPSEFLLAFAKHFQEESGSCLEQSVNEIIVD